MSLFGVIAEITIISFLHKIRKAGAPLEKQFLFVAATLGLFFVIFIPPGQAPDEIAHFRRAYALSEGIVIPSENIYDNAIGSDIPVDANYLGIGPARQTYRNILDRLIHKNNDTSKQPYTSAALYHPVCYFVQAIAILLGKLLDFSVMGMSYIISLFNLLTWLSLSYFAVKLTPKFKSLFMFILLFPMTIQEATSLSPDALVIGLSFFFIAYILHIAYGDIKRLKRSNYLILAICSMLIGLCKIVYLPLVLLILLIPASKFGSKKRKRIVFGAVVVIAAILNISWLVISANYLVEYNPGVNSGLQLFNVITHPLKYLMTIFRTVNEQGRNWLVGIFGLSIGGFRLAPPVVLLFLHFTILVLLFAQKDEPIKLKLFDRFLTTFVFLAITVLVFTSLYMQWTPLGAATVQGIQGRYFIPILPLIPLVIRRSKPQIKNIRLISETTILYCSIFTGIIICIAAFTQNF